MKRAALKPGKITKNPETNLKNAGEFAPPALLFKGEHACKAPQIVPEAG